MENKFPVINLNCSNIAPKLKWEKSIKKAKEGNWVLYLDSSNNEEDRVGSRWVLYGGKIQGKEGMRKLATVWDGEIKAIAEALTT